MLGSPGSPAQPVALPHCVCEWERGTPTPPGHPPPTSPLEVRLGEMGPAPAQAPCQHFRGPSTRASNQSRAIDRWTDPPSQGVARLTAARHTGKVTGGEQTKRWGVLESGDISKVHPPRELVLRPHCVEGQRHGGPVVSCRRGTARGTGEVVTQP